MTAARPPRHTGPLRPALLVLALLVPAVLVLAGCASLRDGKPARGSSFLARQYLERGRAAWAAGNEANARFLIGRAVELDPGSADALAQWSAHWPADSLPSQAREALESRDAGGSRASDEPVADAAAGEESPAGADSPADAAASPEQAGAPAAPGSRVGPGRAAPGPPPRVSARDALAGLADLAAGDPAPAPAPEEELAPGQLAALRARFDAARSRGDRAGLRAAGEALLAARARHLPDLHRVLATWLDYRVDPAQTEARARDALGSLEFGDPAYLAGKPDDVPDGAWLRAWRGRFLDLLGWSAFARGDLAQAEAALRSAETEINLRGRGDVSHLRHLAAFYERRGDLAKAESYAIGAAARDETGSGEVRALASRLWMRRHGGGRSGLEARLASEAERVRREERSAATEGRLYQPLPELLARREDGQPPIAAASLRGRVTVVVLWEPGCEECLSLLRDLSKSGLAGAASAGASRPGRGAAPVEVLALTASEGADERARRAVRALPGVIEAAPERPRAVANALGAGRLPLTLVVEPAGIVQYRHAGYPSESRARERWLERLGWQVRSLRSLTDPASSAKR